MIRETSIYLQNQEFSVSIFLLFRKFYNRQFFYPAIFVQRFANLVMFMVQFLYPVIFAQKFVSLVNFMVKVLYPVIFCQRFANLAKFMVKVLYPAVQCTHCTLKDFDFCPL